MREPEIAEVQSGTYGDRVEFRTLRAGSADFRGGLYLLVPLRNEQEGYALIDRLKQLPQS